MERGVPQSAIDNAMRHQLRGVDSPSSPYRSPRATSHARLKAAMQAEVEELGLSIPLVLR